MSLNIPGYKITRLLGRGGMAKVYLATQEVFEREVALKIMSRALAEDSNFGQRFFREAKIVSQLVHPNIVTVHDVGSHEGFYYLSMEYVDGQDLKMAGPTMNLRQKIRAVKDVARALEYAGEKGYVHRDIKPENIMFHTSDGRAVLMDFGIARASESDTQVTQTGTAIGTPHYMSPEQAKGKRVDPRSDIYSLGVVFYYILAGHVPYDAESAVAIGIKHITEPVPLLPKEYEGFQPIIDRMMAKNVEQRYQNARELIQDLDGLDVELLEHAAGFIVQSGVSSAVTEPSITMDDSAAEESFEEDAFGDPHSSTFDEYLNETTKSHKERGPILPWLVAGAFVVAVVTGFFYIKHPEWFVPVEQKIAALKESKPVRVVPAKVEKATPLPKPVQTPQQEQVSLASGTISRGQSAKSPEPTIEPSPEIVSSNSAGPDSAEQIAALQKQVQALEESYQSDNNYLPSLVESLRQLDTLGDSDAGKKLNALKVSLLSSLRGQAKDEGLSQGFEKRLQQAVALFPSISNTTRDKLLNQAKTRKKVLSYVLEAEAYLKQNNLTKPAGRNALDFYNKALALDPENERALQGKSHIAQKLANAAKQMLSSGKRKAAITRAQKALEIDGRNTVAKEVLAKGTAQQSRIDNISGLLASADQKISSGDLFTPNGAGAFHDFKAVLKLDPTNTRAKQGLERVVDALSAKMWQLVGEQKFAQAQELLRVPLAEFGENQRVQSLSSALSEVMEG